MELTYLLIAAAIVVLAIVLAKLLTGRSGDTDKVLGAGTYTSSTVVSSSDSGKLLEQVQALLAQGKKIEAIKLARELTGVPLEAAKGIVETIEKGQPLGTTTRTYTSTFELSKAATEQLRQLIAQGNQVEAIKLVRDHTGLDLKSAKEIVDQLR